jgi:hypothetical protein
MPVAMTATDIQPIQPAWNSPFLYFGTAEVGTGLELTWNNITSAAVKLGYDAAWRGTSTSLIIQAQPGWTLIPNDALLAWSSAGSVWVAQVLPALIKAVMDPRNPPSVTSSFTFMHPATGRKNDPVVVVGREG